MAQTLFERAQLERGDDNRAKRDQFLEQAVRWYQHSLTIDSENADAHYGLAQAFAQLGKDEESAKHRALYEKYQLDNNAHDRATALARRKNPAADHAANPVAIYELKNTTLGPGPN